MKYVKWILIIFVITSVGYLVAKEYTGIFYKQVESSKQSQSIEYSNEVVVYYFHGNRRCPTCRAIEEYSHEVLLPYIDNNEIIWEPINIDSVDNKHFIYDFNLVSSGPIIVEYNYGKVKRWLALDKVWQLVKNKEAFNKYINGKINDFLERNSDG